MQTYFGHRSTEHVPPLLLFSWACHIETLEVRLPKKTNHCSGINPWGIMGLGLYCIPQRHWRCGDQQNARLKPHKVTPGHQAVGMVLFLSQSSLSIWLMGIEPARQIGILHHIPQTPAWSLESCQAQRLNKQKVLLYFAQDREFSLPFLAIIDSQELPER